jgi:hypothetical protein
MKKLPKEIRYTNNYYSTLEEYIINNNDKIDKTNNCFIYFNLGEDAKEFLTEDLKQYAVDTVTGYNFIKELETRFKIYINVFDLEYLFKYNKERNKNSVIKINDLTLTYENAYKIIHLIGDNISKITPAYFSKVCGTTGLFVFLIKDVLDYFGISGESGFSTKTYWTYKGIVRVIERKIDKIKIMKNPKIK